MFKKIVTVGNDHVMVYDTKLNLRMVYMACPWAETRYHICNERLIEDFCMTQKHIRPFAMDEGDKYILCDSHKSNGVNHYYFRREANEDNAIINTSSNNKPTVICHGLGRAQHR